MAEIIVIFDFDRTLIDSDSDRWVLGQMGLKELFYQLIPTIPWNALMDRMMEELHLRGNTVAEIAECLKGVPLHPNVISAIQNARELGCDLRIVSDANRFYIDTILTHHGVLGFFSEISTNPAVVGEDGRLRILPFHDFVNSPPHGCPLCPPNMCKGIIIGKIRGSTSVDHKKHLIYIGDGNGDFCPSTKLTDEDYVMPRRDHPLLKRINNNPLLVKANVNEWSNGEELEKTLLHIINTINNNKGCTLPLNSE